MRPASRLQVGRAPLFAALPAAEAAETAQVAQTGSSTATETARLRLSSPQLAHPGVETGALLRRISVSDLHSPNRQNNHVWASGSLEVPVTETVKQSTRMMVWGMMNCVWSLSSPYRASRQNCHIGQLHGGSAEGDGSFGDVATDGGLGSNSGRNSVRHVAGHFSWTESQFVPLPGLSGGARPTSPSFGRREYGRVTAQTCRSSKIAGRSSRKRSTRWIRRSQNSEPRRWIQRSQNPSSSKAIRSVWRKSRQRL